MTADPEVMPADWHLVLHLHLIHTMAALVAAMDTLMVCFPGLSLSVGGVAHKGVVHVDIGAGRRRSMSRW